MQIIESIDALKAFRRKTTATIAFVPTMGNLHQGHLALIDAAKKQAKQTWVSIFVNPLQFSAGEDLSNYPRTIEQDCQALKAQGVDMLFLPTVKTIYPRPLEQSTQVIVPVLSKQLCGISRPGHLEGVTTVLIRLFNLVQADVALFGNKDLQQLRIVQRMVYDLALNLRIDAVDTVRETDGLAKSSRNQYLNTEQRANASRLYQTLQNISQSIQQGQRDYLYLEQQAYIALQNLGFKPDYVAIRAASFLQMPQNDTQNIAILAAAYLGKARLIDNICIDLSK